MIPLRSLPLLILVVGIFTACQNEKKPEGTPAAAGAPAGAPKGGGSGGAGPVEGMIVKPSALNEIVTASGTLTPEEETELHPEASGRVVSLNLPEGRLVKKGQMLLKIFDEDLKTQMRKTETQLKQAEITEQRLNELLKVKGVSQQEYDLAVLQTQTLRSELDLQRINLAKTELRAPYDGIIGLRRISVGAYVNPTTAVTTIRSASALKLDFSVPEKYSQQIRIGQRLTFQVEGSKSAHQATVQATEQSISADTRNLMVRAQVNDSKGLLPGSFAEVNLTLGNRPQALMVPSQAIIPQARDKKIIVNRGGKAQFLTVKTGIRQSGMVEIIEGLNAGDTIATTGILFLRPDMPISFSKID
ncbi:MAG: efflux RND transporter periplasmic adaptor subunit [Saprospiraceae bacterium]|nr:efflux RND transporter periplasmic adaptor subunit [Saprospiraceae bacterium]